MDLNLALTTTAIFLTGIWLSLKSWERAVTRPEEGEKGLNRTYLLLAFLVDGIGIGLIVSVVFF